MVEHCTISYSVMETCHWQIDHPITSLLSTLRWDRLNKWLQYFISNKQWPACCSYTEWLLMDSQSDVVAVWQPDSTVPSRHRHSHPWAMTELTTKILLLNVQKYVIVFKWEIIKTSARTVREPNFIFISFLSLDLANMSIFLKSSSRRQTLSSLKSKVSSLSLNFSY